MKRIGAGLTLATAALVAAGCTSSSSGVVTNTSGGGGGGGGGGSSSGGGSQAHLGQPIVLKGNDSGEQATVIARKVIDPASSGNSFDGPGKGKRWVAVQFKIKDTGTTSYDDSPSNGAKVIDSKGQQFDATIASSLKGGALFGGDVKISPGSFALGYLVFEVPKHARIVAVQFGLDSGFAQTGQWKL